MVGGDVGGAGRQAVNLPEPHGLSPRNRTRPDPFSDQFTYQNPEGGLYLKREGKDASAAQVGVEVDFTGL